MEDKAICPCGQKFEYKGCDFEGFNLCPKCRDETRCLDHPREPLHEIAAVVTVPEDVVEAVIGEHEEFLRDEQQEPDQYAAHHLVHEWLQSQIDTSGQIFRAILAAYDMPETREE